MKVLVVDDDQLVRDSIVSLLEFEDIEMHTASNGLAAKRLLESEVFAAVISDLKMPGMDGLELLKWIQTEGPAIPVIIISAFGELDDAVKAMKLGARDYIAKDFEPEEFVVRLKSIVENQELRDLVEAGRRERPEYGDWIGQSSTMNAIKQMVTKIASTLSTVLITGKSGTGKEVIAREIHRFSTRAEKPFIAVNIGGVPENLIESELFGYEKGAFTGANTRKIGMFELASSGTLFLDEIGDMPLHLQVKLLRVIQEMKIQRLGSTQSIPIDARIIAATNRNLEDRVKQGLFREDLFYRLNVIRIEVPDLQERKEDIPLLIGHFIKKFNRIQGKSIQGIGSDAIRTLQSYDFPGNVRELENIIERAVILAEKDTITVKDLSLAPVNSSTIPMKKGTLAELEKQAILDTLRRWEGNRTRAAKELGIDRSTLLRKIKEYGLKRV
jgi:two-component system response regulator AtoC